MRAALLLTCLGAMTASHAQAATVQPITLVPGFGKVSPVEGAANRPDPALRYRVVFSVKKAADAASSTSPSLEKIARFLNLLGSSGIRPKRSDIVVIVHGAATSLVLGDSAYRDRYGIDNPNRPLIEALRHAGVTIHVCGQALASQHIPQAAVSPEVVTDLSAMTTIATLQLRGWVLIPE